MQQRTDDDRIRKATNLATIRTIIKRKLKELPDEPQVFRKYKLGDELIQNNRIYTVVRVLRKTDAYGNDYELEWFDEKFGQSYRYFFSERELDGMLHVGDW